MIFCQLKRVTVSLFPTYPALMITINYCQKIEIILHFFIFFTPPPPRNNCDIFIVNSIRPLGQQNVGHNSQSPEGDVDPVGIMIIPGNQTITMGTAKSRYVINVS